MGLDLFDLIVLNSFIPGLLWNYLFIGLFLSSAVTSIVFLSLFFTNRNNPSAFWIVPLATLPCLVTGIGLFASGALHAIANMVASNSFMAGVAWLAKYLTGLSTLGAIGGTSVFLGLGLLLVAGIAAGLWFAGYYSYRAICEHREKHKIKPAPIKEDKKDSNLTTNLVQNRLGAPIESAEPSKTNVVSVTPQPLAHTQRAQPSHGQNPYSMPNEKENQRREQEAAIAQLLDITRKSARHHR